MVEEALRLVSTLICPNCGRAATLQMPEDSCLIRYDCPCCGATLKPRAGDCCVFCSFGDVPCPPVQQSRACCGGQGAKNAR